MRKLFRWIRNFRQRAVDKGLCDFSGQGRDKYGR